MKDEFIKSLRSTKREGIEETISQLDKIGFFKAPASTRFHLHHEGGLLEHSMNVCEVALRLRRIMLEMDQSLSKDLKEESVIIAALLHDVCKANIYKPATVSRKWPDGHWEKVPGYEVDYSDLPLGHGEKSVIMLLSLGLKLAKSEMLAIRWHMTAWDLAFQSPEQKANLQAAKVVEPLCTLIQAADALASDLLERNNFANIYFA